MREIKFRAWTYWNNVQEYKMLHSDNITEHKSFNAVNFTFEIDGEFVKNIMQYTGLKDKYETEIYEGDIVIWESMHTQMPRVVEFYEGSFVVCGNKPLGLHGMQRGCKVIGNIFENSELLRRAKEY